MPESEILKLADELAEITQLYITNKELFNATRGKEKERKPYYVAAANWKHVSCLLESKLAQYLTARGPIEAQS